MSPVLSSKNQHDFPSPNRKIPQKIRHDPSLSRISRDYSIDSINLSDGMSNASPSKEKGLHRNGPMESRSSINLGPKVNNARNNLHNSNNKEAYHKK